MLWNQKAIIRPDHVRIELSEIGDRIGVIIKRFTQEIHQEGHHNLIKILRTCVYTTTGHIGTCYDALSGLF